MKAQERHQFALFIDGLEEPIIGKQFVIQDTDIIRRIAQVLRLQVADELILFDRTISILLTINSIKKQAISGLVLDKHSNLKLKPYIKLLLPILKKEALAQAVYNAVEAGANEIQLIFTHKTAHTISAHDLDRLERVAVAAAEQSKHFSFPVIQPPISLEQARIVENAVGIFFDPTGSAITQLQSSIAGQHNFCLLVGPEGDLTHAEKEQLRNAGWLFCALTPTILRAAQAVSMGIGLWRSFLR